MIAWQCLLWCTVAWVAPPATFDQTVCCGTDGAAMLVYEPPALEHRQGSPAGWTHTDFACRNEYLAGRLIAFDTGGDGGFCLRLTDGNLTAREKQFIVATHKFRFRVSTGRVCVDGDRRTPNEDHDPKADPYREDQFVAVPLGDYEVTAYHCRDFEDDNRPPEQHLPWVVLVFRRVKDIGEVPVTWPLPLRMDHLKYTMDHKEPPSYMAFEEDLTYPLDDLYLASVQPSAYLAPNNSTKDRAEIERPLAENLKRRRSDGLRPSRIVLVESATAPTIGMLVGVRAHNPKSGRSEASFTGIRPVRVLDARSRDGLLEVEVAPLTRPRSKVPNDEMAAIKADFNDFAKRNDAFRKDNKNPDFINERMAAMESPQALTNCLLQYVPLSSERRLALLPLSDLERIQGLRQALKSRP